MYGLLGLLEPYPHFCPRFYLHSTVHFGYINVIHLLWEKGNSRQLLQANTSHIQFNQVDIGGSPNTTPHWSAYLSFFFFMKTQWRRTPRYILNEKEDIYKQKRKQKKSKNRKQKTSYKRSIHDWAMGRWISLSLGKCRLKSSFKFIFYLRFLLTYLFMPWEVLHTPRPSLHFISFKKLFQVIRLYSIVHIHIYVNESRHIYMSRFINIYMNVDNTRKSYNMKQKKLFL